MVPKNRRVVALCWGWGMSRTAVAISLLGLSPSGVTRGPWTVPFIFELDLVWVKFEVMLGEASLQVKNSAIMILGDIF